MQAVLEDESMRGALIEVMGVRDPRLRREWDEMHPDAIVDLEAALIVGYNYAILTHFMEEKSITNSWLVQHRSNGITPAVTGKDRRYDYELVSHYYPELRTYYPGKAITKSEVLISSSLAFYDLVFSPGSDFEDSRRQERFTGNYGKVWDGLFNLTERGGASFGSHGVTLWVKALSKAPLLEDSILATLARLTCQVGPRPALYWAWRTLYDGSYTSSDALLNSLGESTRGRKGHDGFRRDLDRKMKFIDREVRNWEEEGIPDILGLDVPPEEKKDIWDNSPPEAVLLFRKELVEYQARVSKRNANDVGNSRRSSSGGFREKANRVYQRFSGITLTPQSAN